MPPISHKIFGIGQQQPRRRPQGKMKEVNPKNSRKNQKMPQTRSSAKNTSPDRSNCHSLPNRETTSPKASSPNRESPSPPLTSSREGMHPEESNIVIALPNDLPSVNDDVTADDDLVSTVPPEILTVKTPEPQPLTELPNGPPSLDSTHFPSLPTSSKTPHTQATAPNLSQHNPTSATTTTYAPPNKPHPFAELFKGNRTADKCMPLEMGTKTGRIKVKEEGLLTIEEAWGHSFIGFLVGLRPNNRIVQALIKIWGVECQFFVHKSGWVVFSFNSKDHMDEVLLKGPYASYGRQWIIKKVPKLFTFSDTCFTSVPIWVNLNKLPKQCWSKSILSEIATQLGTPVCMDMVTARRMRHESARILVEVDITQEPVMKVELEMPDGRIWDQTIDYETPPFLCGRCKRIGHKEEECQPRKSGSEMNLLVTVNQVSQNGIQVPQTVSAPTVIPPTVSAQHATKPLHTVSKELMASSVTHCNTPKPLSPVANRAKVTPTVTAKQTVTAKRVGKPLELSEKPSTGTTTALQSTVSTNRVVTHNPFSALAGLDTQCGSSRVTTQIEEDLETPPVLIQALQDDDFQDYDLLIEEENMEEETLRLTVVEAVGNNMIVEKSLGDVKRINRAAAR